MTREYHVHIKTERFVGIVQILDDRGEAERLARTLIGVPVGTPSQPAIHDQRVLEAWIEEHEK